jgi:hypothetical protein
MERDPQNPKRGFVAICTSCPHVSQGSTPQETLGAFHGHALEHVPPAERIARLGRNLAFHAWRMSGCADDDDDVIAIIEAALAESRACKAAKVAR